MTPPAQPVKPTPWGVVRHYWRVARGRWWHVAIPVTLITLSNAFEGASLSLIIPLTEAMSENSFDFLEESRAWGWILDLMPEGLADSPSRDGYLVALVVGLLVLGRIGKLVFQYLARVYAKARTERYRVAVSQETFGRVLRFGRQYFDRQAVGRIDAEIGWSASVLGLLEAAEGLFRHTVAIVVKGVVMFAISVPLLITFAVVLPLVQWVVTSINKAVRRIAQEGVEVDRRVRARTLDILSTIPLVKSYSQEQETAESYAQVLREAESVAVRKDRMMALRYPVEEITILISMLLAQGVLIYTAGEFRPAEVAVFAGFLVVLQQSLRDYKLVSGFTLTVMEQLPKLEALAHLFADDGKFIVPSGDRSFEGLREGIAVRDLTFRYEDGTETLRGIDAFMPAGNVTAIVGPSGSGKTTLVDLIARLYDCPPGTIFLDDEDIRSFSLPTLHARMALVSQHVWLLNRSLRDNLTFGLRRAVADAELMDVLEDMELRAFVEELPEGLDTEVGDHGIRLSGGQRQRVALARALLRDPSIMILDEATSALDSHVELRVADAIVRRARGRTLIVIAHRLSTIRDADQILVLEGGRIVERGTWTELLDLGGVFASLHSAQFEAEPARR